MIFAATVNAHADVKAWRLAKIIMMKRTEDHRMRIRRPLGDQIVLRTITALIVVCIAAFPVGAAFAQDLFEADAVGGAACEPVAADPLSGCIATDGTRNVVIGRASCRERVCLLV